MGNVLDRNRSFASVKYKITTNMQKTFERDFSEPSTPRLQATHGDFCRDPLTEPTHHAVRRLLRGFTNFPLLARPWFRLDIPSPLTEGFRRSAGPHAAIGTVFAAGGTFKF